MTAKSFRTLTPILPFSRTKRCNGTDDPADRLFAVPFGTGTLWDGRSKSSIADAERYPLACRRCIEANPIRAGMAADAAAYPWSRDRNNGLGRPVPLLSGHLLEARWANPTRMGAPQ